MRYTGTNRRFQRFACVLLGRRSRGARACTRALTVAVAVTVAVASASAIPLALSSTGHIPRCIMFDMPLFHVARERLVQTVCGMFSNLFKKTLCIVHMRLVYSICQLALELGDRIVLLSLGILLGVEIQRSLRRKFQAIHRVFFREQHTTW